MYCGNCGKEIQSGAHFCMNCGAPVDPDGTINQEERAHLPKFQFNKKSAVILVIAAILLCAVGIGVWMVTGVASAETVPREPEKAAEYFSKRFEELEKDASEERYDEYFDAADQLDGAILGVFLSESEEEPYDREILEMTREASQRLDDLNLEHAVDVITALNETKDYEAMTRFYNSRMLNEKNRDQLVDLMFYAFADQKDFTSAELCLRELLNPFSESALKKTLEYQSYLDEHYPDREKPYTVLDGKTYDKAMPFSDGLARVAVNVGSDTDKVYQWGLIDQDGKEVLATKYDTIGGFLEGLAAVQDHGKWGFVDESGRMVIEPQYDDLKDTQDAIFYAYAKRDPENVLRGFYDGFAAVQKNGKWGFIDQDGNTLGEGIIYQDVWYFNEEFAAVELNNKYGLIDSSGRYVIRPDSYGPNGINFDVVRPIYEGLAGVNWNGRTERGIIDKDGSLVRMFDKTEVDLVQDYREGLASVRKYQGAKAKWGFVDRSGYIVIPLRYDSVNVFINGVSKVCNDGLYGLIDRNGRTLLPLAYAGIGEFTDGFAVLQKNGLYGFAEEDGSVLVEPKYEKVTNFSDGMACVRLGGKWGVIDTAGDVILEPVFEDMKEFNGGVAPAKMNGKWGYVDAGGFFVVEPLFEKANVFSDGLAAVSDGKGYYYISLAHTAVNLDGKVLDEWGEPVASARIDVFPKEDVRLRDPIFTTVTDAQGGFKALLPSGSYQLAATKEGYVYGICYEEIEPLISNYATTITLVNIDSDENAEASVRIGNALDGAGLSGAEVRFRKGFNNKEGSYVRDESGTVILRKTNGEGTFRVELPRGIYTAEAKLEGYATVYINFAVSSVSGAQQLRTQAMTEVLPEGETRITLEWGMNPPDLDSHLVGPMADSYEKFHIFYPVKGEEIGHAMLDKDDTSGNGFETTTIYKQTQGVYRYSVFDYTNGGNYVSEEMSRSGARVSVYRGDSCVAVFDIPTDRMGNLWEVFELDGDRIIPINNVTSHHDTSFYQY